MSLLAFVTLRKSKRGAKGVLFPQARKCYELFARDRLQANMSDAWLDDVHWGADGLVPAIAQEAASGAVLMVAWMNREALALTVREGRAIYWSRSRAKLWRKGEESGHVQVLKDIRLDCDNDVLLLSVEQQGGIACHTGRHNCFFKQLRDETWVSVDPVLKDPEHIYK